MSQIQKREKSIESISIITETDVDSSILTNEFNKFPFSTLLTLESLLIVQGNSLDALVISFCVVCKT